MSAAIITAQYEYIYIKTRLSHNPCDPEHVQPLVVPVHLTWVQRHCSTNLYL